MKKLLVLLMCLLCVSCASTNMPKKNKADKKNVANKELPSWVNECPTSKNGLYAVGSESHKEIEQARILSLHNARAELSKKQNAEISSESHMNTVITKDDSDISYEESTILKSNSNVDNAIVKGTHLEYDKKTKKWYCYTLLYREYEVKEDNTKLLESKLAQ